MLRLVCLMAGLGLVVAPPPRGHVQPPQPTEEEMNMNSETLGLEYRNYLEEVVKTLEQDEQFKTILQNATDEDIKSGSVADQLHLVDPQLRSKLDELKRIELQRLRQRATEAFELSNGLDRNAIKEPLHLEHRNPHTFREEDLRKLIHKTTRDLEDLDKQRHEDFKKYEMEKEFKYQEELKGMDEEHKKEAQNKHELEQKKKKEHAPGEPQVHHPLSEDQLEEVWQEQDQMSRDDFDPVTFFRMHDLDGNEVLDQTEVMALFKRELDKMYNGTDADPREREEEMNEMREATFSEVDTDRDGFISLKEFIASTQHDDYRHDQGWEGVNERDQYQQNEYEAYERQRMAEIQRQINMGMLPPPHQGYQPPPGYAGQPGMGQPPVNPAGFVPPHLAGMPQQPGMPQQQPGMVQQQPGMPQQQPGMVQQQPGMPQQQPGMIQQQGGGQPQLPGQHPAMAQQQFQQAPNQQIPHEVHQQVAQMQQQIHQQMQQQQIPAQQQQIPVQQQQQIPVQQQQQMPVRVQQMPVQQQQIPVQQQQQMPVQQQQQMPVRVQQMPVQQQQIPVQQQQQIPVQQQKQQQQAGAANQIPVQTRQ